VRLPPVSPLAYRRIALFALVALGVIIVTGAAVRLTGSGLGCSDWPNCSENQFVASNDFHERVEFGNRLFTGIVSIAVALAVLGSLVRQPRRRDLTWWSLGLVAGVFAQALLGAVVVKQELTPPIVMAHFLLSLLALGVAVVVTVGVYDFVRATPVHTPLAANWLAVVLVPSTLALIVTGTLVTAAGPHSGGEKIKRYGLLPDALHLHAGATGIFAIAFVGIVVSLLWHRAEARGDLRFALAVLGLLLVQMAIGDIQWREHLPWPLVLVHVTFATAIWAGVVALASRLLLSSRPVLA